MFLVDSTELQTANKSFEDKLAEGHATDKSMFSISWDIEELKAISSECRKIHHKLQCCLDACCSSTLEDQNIPRKLLEIRPTLCTLIKRIAHFRRTPATHVFIMMISSETRDKKPYALPVQCIPYAGLKEADIRRLVTNLCKEMVTLGMKVSGKYNSCLWITVPLAHLITQDFPVTVNLTICEQEVTQDHCLCYRFVVIYDLSIVECPTAKC